MLKNKLKSTIENFVINIGNLIVNSLIEQKILKKELHRKEVPTICIATFYKPSLVDNEIDLVR